MYTCSLPQLEKATTLARVALMATGRSRAHAITALPSRSSGRLSAKSVVLTSAACAATFPANSALNAGDGSSADTGDAARAKKRTRMDKLVVRGLSDIGVLSLGPV